MTFNYSTTPAYYAGFQKRALLSDKLVRQAFLSVGAQMVLSSISSYYLPKSIQLFVGILLDMLIVLPVVIHMAGGMNAKGWKWYGALGCGQIVIEYFIFSKNAVPALVVIPISVFCIYQMHRSNPHVLKNLGFLEKEPALKEILFILGTALALATPAYVSYILTDHTFHYLGVARYTALLFHNMVIWGCYTGLFYGILMRHFLKLKIQPIVAILINILLLFGYWGPSAIGFDPFVVGIAGVFASCINSQIALGLAFQFCRTTRMPMGAFILYSLMVRSFLI